MLVDRLYNQANAFVAITFHYSWNMFTSLLTRHANNTIYNRHINTVLSKHPTPVMF